MAKRSNDVLNKPIESSKNKVENIYLIFPKLDKEVIRNLYLACNFNTDDTLQAILDQERAKNQSGTNNNNKKGLQKQNIQLEPIIIDDDITPNKQTKLGHKSNPVEIHSNITNKFETSSDHEIALQLQLALNEENKPSEQVGHSVPDAAVIPLEYGVVLFKNCLTQDEQIGIYHQSLEIANNFQSETAELPQTMLQYWSGMGFGSSKEPTELLKFGSDMFKRAYQLSKKVSAFKIWEEEQSPDFRFPTNYNPNALHGIAYTSKAKLQSHLDGNLGWVLSVSIGDSALFFFSKTLTGNRTEIKIESGDVLIFNGAKLFHGIDKIYPETAPPFWKNIRQHRALARFNLQFRDPSTFF